MTYTRFEVDKVTCDDCRESKEITINIEAENEIEVEERWVSSLIKSGWIYNKENETHKCPSCAKIEGD